MCLRSSSPSRFNLEWGLRGMQKNRRRKTPWDKNIGRKCGYPVIAGALKNNFMLRGTCKLHFFIINLCFIVLSTLGTRYFWLKCMTLFLLLMVKSFSFILSFSDLKRVLHFWIFSTEVGLFLDLGLVQQIWVTMDHFHGNPPVHHSTIQTGHWINLLIHPVKAAWRWPWNQWVHWKAFGLFKTVIQLIPQHL